MKIRKEIKINPSGFVFNANSGDSYTINSLGLEVILLLKKGKSKETIVEDLIETYDTNRSVLEKDVSEFLLMLQHHKLAK